jgi:hypothetical protein
VLPHPPYSPDLAPSDFHLFGALKDAILGTMFETDDHLIHAVRTWLRKQGKSWYRQHICSLLAHGLRSGGRLCGIIGYGVKPSLFMMCNFCDLGLFTEKKIRGVTLWTNLLIISWKTCESLVFTHQSGYFHSLLLFSVLLVVITFML